MSEGRAAANELGPPPGKSAIFFASVSSLGPAVTFDGPDLPDVSAAAQATIRAHDVAGAVTVVAVKDAILHLQANGLSDFAANEPRQEDRLFSIASMIKPITSGAVLLLQNVLS